MCSVLIVEDEPLIGLGMSVMLAEAGFDVVGTVGTGPATLEAVSRNRPSIVLMDVTLPGPIDGIETARLLKERFGVSVLYVTGQTDPASKARAMAMTPRGYLSKPFSAEQLTDALRKALGTGVAASEEQK